MRLYDKAGGRRREGERNPFTFFVIGAMVVLIAVFLVGLQVGRVIEKSSTGIEEKGAGPRGPAAVAGRAASPGASDIKKELGAFSEEANKVPAVPPPPASARDAVRETEKGLTFQQTLETKHPEPVPLVKPAQKDGAREPSAGSDKGSAAGYHVQAGAFRKKDAAESLRKKLAKAGFKATVSRRETRERGTLYRVLVGPYPEAASAGKAARRIKANLKINAIVAPG